MSVHYKFKSALEYDTVTFDGLHISVNDLKNAIIQQKRIGKSTDFDLQVTNAQTKEVYEDENTLIPKNTSLLIARIPVLVQKAKTWEGYGGDSTPPQKTDEAGPIAKAVDLSSLDAPEDDKIKAMMSQSTQEYDPSNYVKIRGANQVGAVPPNYRCYKCHQGGHWIKDCTFGQGSEPIEIKKSTGIPRNFLVPVEGPQVPGAMMTPNGQYAVPMLDLQAYNQKVTPAPVPAPKVDIPEDLICSICQDLLADAVMIPCCGNSFCDECIRGVLLESEDHECPDCHEKDISPDTLIPNRFLRTSVSNFKNTTGYVKKPTYRERIEPVRPQLTKETSPPKEPESTEKVNLDEKTVISEADSTENTKSSEGKDIDSSKEEDSKNILINKEIGSTPEGPPGVSPKNSPTRSPIDQDRQIRRIHSSRESKERGRRNSHSSRARENSPRKSSRKMRSPSYSSPISHEERSGTPTVDEPTSGAGYTPYGGTGSVIPSGSIPGTVPSLIGAVPPLQGPPPPGISAAFPPGQPPMGGFPSNQGPMPNYRLPPPGSAPFLGPGPFPVPPRAMFDGSRPPIGGFPPNFNPNIPPGSRSHRDFNRRVRDRTPPGLIDDPLAAFNRMLREKDERKRRAKRRSYSRSRSRSRSFSRSPVRRRGSRSPRPTRRSRSRSRSFSLSRSRSRSYTGSPWGSPYNNRQASPPARRSPLVARRSAPTSRYRSPPPLRSSRSPPSRSRHPSDRHRDFEEDRDYGERDRSYKDRNRERGLNNRDRRPTSRDRDRYYDNYDDRSGSTRGDSWQQNRAPPIQDGYYPPPADIQQGYQNRFGQGPPREYVPSYMNKEAPLYSQPVAPQRQFQDIKPPGVDDDIAPPGVDEPPPQPLQKLSPKREDKEKDKDKERRRSRDRRDRSSDRDRKRRHDRKSRTPDKTRNPSPKRKSKSRDRDSPEKHKRRRRDSSDREERKRDHSEDVKSKKSSDKKKHKDKKESDKKKKRDKKDKHKKETKDKKAKEEFKQVIPKNRNDDYQEDIALKEKKRDSHEKTSREDSKRRSEETLLKEKSLEKKESEELPITEGNELPAKKIKKELKVKKSKEIDLKQSVKESKTEMKIEKQEEEPIPSTTPARVEYGDLYGDLLNEDIDTKVIENYGKIDEENVKEHIIGPAEKLTPEDEEEEGEIKEIEDEESEEKDVLELHLNDIDLKAELDKSDILAPVPEISKWEVEEDLLTSPKDGHKLDSKMEKSGKVTNEVLKRAENAIFAKAIKAIRPLEIKKREVEKSNNKIQVTVASAIDISSPPVPQRLSVKERLGVKVDDPDKVINLSRNRSRSISPFSRRGEGGRNFDANDRRVELDSVRNRRVGRNRSRSRGRDHSRDRKTRVESRAQIRDNRRRSTHGRDKSKKEERSRHDDDRKSSRRKRTRSRSDSEEKKDKHKKKDKKQKKEKSRNRKDEEESKIDKEGKEEGKQPVVTKRKPTIDEATFEPDYDLESHSEEEENVSTKKKASKKQSEEEDEKSSNSESGTDSSSDEDRKRKKHKKHKKKKKKESSTSSSSESESESSDSDKGKKRRKHKKNKKKKKKSKHK